MERKSPRPDRDWPGAAATSTIAQRADTWAWGAIGLDDGRIVSIAWLRGYVGAVASVVRRG